MAQMKETMDNQRDQIRALKRENQQKTVDVDAVSFHFAWGDMWIKKYYCSSTKTNDLEHITAPLFLESFN